MMRLKLSPRYDKHNCYISESLMDFMNFINLKFLSIFYECFITVIVGNALNLGKIRK